MAELYRPVVACNIFECDCNDEGQCENPVVMITETGCQYWGYYQKVLLVKAKKEEVDRASKPTNAELMPGGY